MLMLLLLFFNGCCGLETCRSPIFITAINKNNLNQNKKYTFGLFSKLMKITTHLIFEKFFFILIVDFVYPIKV